jgi:serine-type D-Ala-D-Ala carboxypeptidase/endopeptidase
MPLRCAALLLWISVCAPAQSASPVGDYSGMLGPLHLKLHLKPGPNASLSGTLDSPDQGAIGLPCANIKIDGKTLNFEVPSVSGKWSGSASADFATLTGTWTQGSPMPLTFQREKPFDAAEKPSPVDGIWLGTLAPASAKLRIQLHVKSDRSGKEYCSLDSLDQGAMGIECENVHLASEQFTFNVPSVKGRFEGKLIDNNSTLDGNWSQGRSLPLRLTRQANAIVPEKPKFANARPPVAASAIKAALDQDLAASLSKGTLAPGTGIGVAIGIIDHGQRQVFVYGAAKPESLFEIGSITKTFTGLILARMVVTGKVKWDEPVRDLLPPGTVDKPVSGSEITLLDLATQHSGLPRMPSNFHPSNNDDPYVDYHAKEMYAFLREHGVAKPSHPDFLYSNFGFGLLGQALSNSAQTTYPELLQTQITGPLNMPNTAIALSPDQKARFAQGHNLRREPAHEWNLDAFAGAGAIRSTADDMLTYLQAQLHPEAASALAEPLKLSHEIHADAGNMKIALAWLFDPLNGNYWHNGGTGGFSSYAFFNPKEDRAAIVLSNITVSPTGSFADRVGEHINELFTGKPAIVLE